MISLDLFLSSPTHKLKQEPVVQKQHPLLSSDIHSCYTDELKIRNRRKQEIRSLEQFAKKHQWDASIAAILQNDYQALILTEKDQTICWANKGFTKMTGYPVNYAIGKKPTFLQGTNTAASEKERIREQLASAEFFSATLLNYRKNKEAYLCKIDIFPLKTKAGKIAHYLALEKEVYDYRRTY